VAALATAGEILATNETLAEVSDIRSSDARETQVKGVTAAVQVAAIAWL
jgi:class 3 adenylate cyclase